MSQPKNLKILASSEQLANCADKPNWQVEIDVDATHRKYYSKDDNLTLQQCYAAVQKFRKLDTYDEAEYKISYMN